MTHRLRLTAAFAALLLLAPSLLLAQPPARRAVAWSAEPLPAAVAEPLPAGEIDPAVLRGLASLRLWAAWIPEQGLPRVHSLPFGAAVRRSVEGDVLYEASSATKVPIEGAAGAGEVTVRVWSWVRPGWAHSEHWLEVANDSAFRPPGDVTGGVWRFALDAPGGYALPRGARPLLLAPWWHPQRPEFLQIDLPPTNLPDGTFRFAPVVIGWGPRALQEATRAHAVPDHGARTGAIGTLWDVDETRGAQAAAKAAQARASWLSKVEPDPWADWGNRRAPGQSGADAALFGQLPLPGLQEGGSDLAADHAILVQLAVEGHRPTWLDWAEMIESGVGYFAPPQRGRTYYDHHKIHRFARPGFARGTWTDAIFGDYHGWSGPNAEHRYQASLFQLAGLTLHPVARDRALQYAARAAAACGLASISDGGYYAGGGRTDFLREWLRMLSCVAQGYHIATRWGFVDLAGRYDAHLAAKYALAIHDPKGYRNTRGNTGDAIPWGNTPMSHSPAGQLRAEDLGGTEFDTDYFRANLRHVNVKAWWQTNQAGPQVLWALRTGNRDGLTGLRDLAFQLVGAVLGPIDNPADVSDPREVRIPKFGSPRVLGLGRGWQTPGKIPPAMLHQVIEGWTYETACWAAIFAEVGLDDARREAYRRALLAVDPAHAWSAWGAAPPERWIAEAERWGGVPDDLPPVPAHSYVYREGR